MKLWIIGMTLLCTGCSLIVSDIVNLGWIVPIRGALGCLFMSVGIVIVKEEKRE